MPRKSHPLMNLNDLDYSITYQICQNFDIDRSWEILAGVIGYSTSQIQAFEMEIQRASGSPTKKLLWDWGSRGGTVKDLYDKLILINRIQCVRLLEHIVVPDKGKEKKAENKSDLLMTDGSSFESKSDNMADSDLQMSLCYDVDSLPIPSLKKNSHLMKESNMPDENLDMSVNKPLMNDKILGMILEPQDVAASWDTGYDRMDSAAGLKDMGGAASSATRSLERVRSVIDEHGSEVMFSTQLSEEERNVAYALLSTKSYTYKELSAATGGFSEQNKLGEGKFGAVFYGVVKNTKCAIKKMYQKKANGEEISPLQEAGKLKALSKYRHEHIVTLYGYAIDNDNVHLVYQYMSQGSLYDCLHNRPGFVLTWEQRLTILRGAACGLQFLHTIEAVPVIHGNIKSGNILLDHHFEAKIGDLGLAKQATGGDIPGQKTHITKKTTSIHDYQTQAYYPPEVMRGNGFSVKGDSFSFGVVMFECLTGQAAYDERKEGSVEEKYLVGFIHSAIEDCPKMDKQKKFQDPKLKEDFPIAIFDILFEIAIKCTEEKKKDRPTMVEVYTQVEKCEQDCDGPEYKNLIGCAKQKNEKQAGSIREHKMTTVGHPTHSPGVKAPPSSKPQTKVPNSPIDLLPKNQPLPEAFKLQRDFDIRNEQKPKDSDYVNVETITQQIKLTYVSDPKKLQEIENYDKAFNAPEQGLGAEKKVPLENTERFEKDPRAMEVSDDSLYEFERAPRKQEPSQNDYERLNKRDESIYGPIVENTDPYQAAAALDVGGQIDFEKEFEEITDKAINCDSSLNDIFDRFHENIEHENLMNFPVDNMNDDEEYDFQFDIETEDSESSTITDSINNDFENMNCSELNDDELFASERHSTEVNVMGKVSNMDVDMRLEEHQNKLAMYQGLTREDSEELHERSAQSDDLEGTFKGQSLPVPGHNHGNQLPTLQNAARYSSLPHQNNGCLKGQGQNGNYKGQVQGVCNYGNRNNNAVSSKLNKPGMEEFLQRREPSEGDCEEYV